jgi:uncharacterized protein YjbJ (UPF0337 family)
LESVILAPFVLFAERRKTMNWDTFEGKFKQLEAAIRERWAKISNDDLEMIAGRRERLAGRIRERYGTQEMRLRSRLTNGGSESKG